MNNKYTIESRLSISDDLQACLCIQGENISRFNSIYPKQIDHWCPAGIPVPFLETEEALEGHLTGKKGDWAAIVTHGEEILGYMLCLVDQNQKHLRLPYQGPHVSPSISFVTAGKALVQFVMNQAREMNLQTASVFLHDLPDEVGIRRKLFKDCGFENVLRLEMVGTQFDLDPGERSLTLQSADEIGREAFYLAEVVSGAFKSIQESEESCDISQRMWQVDLRIDWLAAYDDDDLVGTLRTAVTKDGTGVIDELSVTEKHRGRGIGKQLLTRAMESLKGRTEVVWLDTDEGNDTARRLYEWAGFHVHHVHGGMMTQVK